MVSLELGLRGKDHASERYIFTMLNPTITKSIYIESDRAILDYLDDDGTMVEPEFYAPIIPMVLVNGSKGIGTGFSTDIMCYNISDIINYIKNKLQENDEEIEIRPYYEGFKGEIKKVTSDKYLIKGSFKLIGTDKIEITELPIGTWTEDYKIFLETLIVDNGKKASKKQIIKSYSDMSTDHSISFTIHFVAGTINKYLPKKEEYGCNGLEKVLKLYTTKKTSNMHLFDENQQLKKYKTVNQIIEKYYPVRLSFYQKRKDYIIDELEKIVKKLSNKARFIKEQLDDNLDLRKKKKAQVLKLLSDMGFDLMDGDAEFKYLRNMSIDSVEEENYEKLMKEKDDKTKQLKNIKGKTIQTMWLEELNTLEIQYEKYKKERKERTEGGRTARKLKIKKKIKKKAKK